MGLSTRSGIAGRMFAGVIASVVGTLACSQAWAQSASDAASQGDAPKLKIDEAKRYFVRFGYVAMKPNNKSGEVKDVSGYVATRDEIVRYGEYLNTIMNSPSFSSLPFATQQLISGQWTQAKAVTGYDIYADAFGPDSYPDTSPTSSKGMYVDGLVGLGIPAGITVNAKSAGTPAVSLGYFLDEDQQWAVEGFVLAVPLKNEVYARQTVYARVGDKLVPRPGYLDGKKAMTTQVLPPLVMLTRYFGSKDATWRPSVGIGGAYAIFFDSKVPQFVSDYSGGKTTVSLKNSFGVGAFAGLQYRVDERWHLNATLGYLKLKTTGTLTTNSTRFTYNNPALKDLGGYTGNIIPGESTKVAVNAMLIDLANWKNGGTTGDYGKFVRTIETRLDPYIFWVSAGYSF